jgi:hypothetical protein
MFVKAIGAKASSVYLCQTYTLKLLNMFAMIMSPIFGIHHFVILTFGFMTRLAMILIPKLTNVKGSKCQVCMQES